MPYKETLTGHQTAPILAAPELEPGLLSAELAASPAGYSAPESAISEPVLETAGKHVDAEELFVDHVQRVESEGSPILGRYNWTSRFLQAGVGGMGLGEGIQFIIDATEASPSSGLAAGIWIGAAAITGTIGAVTWPHLRNRRFERRHGYDLQKDIGHAYDLFRVPSSASGKEQSTVLHWHGALVPRNTSEDREPSFIQSVREITKLAQRAQIPSIVVERQLLQDSIPDCELPKDTPGKPTLSDLVSTTGLYPRLKNNENMPLLAFSPRDFRRYVEKELGVAGVDAYVSKLEELSDNDPLVAEYNRLSTTGADEGQLAQVVIAGSRRAMERNMSASPWMTLQEGGTSQSVRGEVSFHIVGNKVSVQRMLRTRDGVKSQLKQVEINDALGIGNEQLAQFSENPDSLTKNQRKLILYRKLYDAARGNTDNDETDGGGSKGGKLSYSAIAGASSLVQPALVEASLLPHFSPRGMEIERAGQAKPIRAHFRRQAGMAAGVLVLSIYAGGGVHHNIQDAVSKRADKLVSDNPNAYADDAGIDKLYDQAWDTSFMTRAFHPIDTEENKITEAVRNYLALHVPKSIAEKSAGAIADHARTPVDPNLGDFGASTAAGSYSIGNQAEGDKNKVQWYLDPHNMKTEGYWGTSTYSEFNNGTWLGTNDEIKDARVQYPTTVGADQEQYIKVHRQNNGGEQELKIPILAGTRLVAINFGGKPVAVESNPDDSITVKLPETEDATDLTYYLGPSALSPALHATHPAQIDPTGGRHISPETIWSKVLPNRSANPEVRAQQEEDYIKDNLGYSLSPYSKQQEELETTYDTMTALLMSSLESNRKVKCDSAASILVADNVQLNFAEGWKNKNTSKGQQVLTSHESHAWALDANGKIYDGTPATSDKQLQKFFDDQGALPQKAEKRDTNNLKDISIGIAGLGAAAYAYRRRRQLQKGARVVAGAADVLAVNAAEMFSDSEGFGKHYAVAAAELPYMRTATASQFNGAVERHLERPSKQLSETPIASTAAVNAQLKEIHVNPLRRLGVAARLGASQFAQSRKRAWRNGAAAARKK